MGSRTIEFILGLIGGILGFIGALAALALGGLAGAVGTAVESEEAVASGSMVVGLGGLALVFAIIGIVGAVWVRSNPKRGGITMLISAFGGLISISWFYSLSFILLLIGGLMGVFKKDKGERK